MSNQDITIRELMPDDAETMIAYSKRIGGETDNLTFDFNGFPISVDDEKKFLASVHDDPKSIMLSAWRGNELIADASLHSMPRRMSHRAELGISVVKDEWNKGIGGMLLEKLIQFAKDADIEIIELSVRSDNNSAIHLYEKYGFKRIGTYPAFFKIENNYYDFEEMYLDLR